mgnify:CR=1 FL=1
MVNYTSKFSPIISIAQIIMGLLMLVLNKHLSTIILEFNNKVLHLGLSKWYAECVKYLIIAFGILILIGGIMDFSKE